MKRKPQQLDINWGEPESFTLTIQPALDGDRIAAETTQQEQDREAAEQQQAALL
jgi:hypothetical protein